MYSLVSCLDFREGQVFINGLAYRYEKIGPTQTCISITPHQILGFGLEA